MKIRNVVMFLAALVFSACVPNDGTDHDLGANEPESWAVTAWGQHFELFPEIDALVAGDTAGAHVHVTLLEGFTPATEGSVTVVLSGEAGTQERFTSTTAVRPGIFNVEIQPGAAGDRELYFEIEVGGVTETIPGGTVRVGSADAPGGLVKPPHSLPAVDGAEVMDFLKEQQWRTRFATAWAVEDALRSSVTGTSRVEPPAGGDVSLTAPVDGVVRATAWPYTGQSVSAGDGLLSLIPSAPTQRSLADLEASVLELEALAEAAAAREERLEGLLAREAASRRQVEQARAEATGLQARLEAGKAELAGAEAARQGRGGVSGLGIRAPFAGRVAEVRVSPGEHVAAGTTLLRVVRERPGLDSGGVDTGTRGAACRRDRRSRPRHRRDRRSCRDDCGRSSTDRHRAGGRPEFWDRRRAHRGPENCRRAQTRAARNSADPPSRRGPRHRATGRRCH